MELWICVIRIRKKCNYVPKEWWYCSSYFICENTKTIE